MHKNDMHNNIVEMSGFEAQKKVMMGSWNQSGVEPKVS